MPRVETIQLPDTIRVAAIIERGKIRPVWFQRLDQPGLDPIRIKEVCAVYDHRDGAAKVIVFCVWDGSNSYRLALNTRDFTWTLGVAVTDA